MSAVIHRVRRSEVAGFGADMKFVDCYCRTKTSKVMVPLRRSMDPEIFLGRCGKCQQRHYLMPWDKEIVLKKEKQKWPISS